jgi:hypothetical protein
MEKNLHVVYSRQRYIIKNEGNEVCCDMTTQEEWKCNIRINLNRDYVKPNNRNR